MRKEQVTILICLQPDLTWGKFDLVLVWVDMCKFAEELALTVYLVVLLEFGLQPASQSLANIQRKWGVRKVYFRQPYCLFLLLLSTSVASPPPRCPELLYSLSLSLKICSGKNLNNSFVLSSETSSQWDNNVFFIQQYYMMRHST